MNPCNECIVKMLCTALCEEKIDQITDKVVKRKKKTNPNFSKRGGILLWDLMDELRSEGKIVIRLEDDGIEVKNVETYKREEIQIAIIIQGRLRPKKISAYKSGKRYFVTKNDYTNLTELKEN